MFSRRGFEGTIDMGFADLPAPDTPLFVLLVRLVVLGQDCRSRVGNATFGHILRIFSCADGGGAAPAPSCAVAGRHHDFTVTVRWGADVSRNGRR